jgi:hypothetical protein
MESFNRERELEAVDERIFILLPVFGIHVTPIAGNVAVDELP